MKNIINAVDSEVKQFARDSQGNVTFIETPKDGKHYNPEFGEWEIWLDGEIWAYAQDSFKADQLYAGMLAQRREHYERCPEDGIPFMGEPAGTADELGLEARGL